MKSNLQVPELTKMLSDNWDLKPHILGTDPEKGRDAWESSLMSIREPMDLSYVRNLKIDSQGVTNWEGKQSFLIHE